jgi:hypothetical protein
MPDDIDIDVELLGDHEYLVTQAGELEDVIASYDDHLPSVTGS